MSQAKNVTLVIPVRNGRRFLATCLDAVLGQQAETAEFAMQVVVVDNASIDGSAEWVAEHYPQVMLIRNRVNRGFAGGCNDGLSAAPAAISILLNQDTCVYPGWLVAVIGVFDDPRIGIVGCKIFYPDGKTIQHAGGYIQQPQQFGLHYSQHELDQGQADRTRPVAWVTGAAFAIHRRVIEQIGLLDEGFWPGYFEDMDYCLRAQAAGFQIQYCAEAVLSHQESSSQIDFESLQRFYQRGRLRFALKHLPPQQWLAEFIAAERSDSNWVTPARQAAYWQTLAIAPDLLRLHWRADDTQVEQVVAALRGLICANPSAAHPWGVQSLPPFSEFNFSSNAPWVGALLSGFRRLWYNVAARWGDQYLHQQQNVVNQHLYDEIRLLNEQTRLLQQQLDQSALANAGLLQQLKLLQSTPPASNEEGV